MKLLDACVNMHRQYNNISDQQDATISVNWSFQSALHVSGDNYAHSEEHVAVITTFGMKYLRCCRRWHGLRPVATSVYHINGCKYSHVLLRIGVITPRNMQSWLKGSMNWNCCILFVAYIFAWSYSSYNTFQPSVTFSTLCLTFPNPHAK